MEKTFFHSLKKSKLFNGLDDSDLQKIIRFAVPSEARYRKNQIIVNQGDSVSRIGILQKGSAISFKNHFNGNTQILRIYNQGEIFSLDAVNTTPMTSPVAISAQSDILVVFVPYLRIFQTEEIGPEVKKTILSNSSEILSNELIRLMYKIDVLSKRTLQERILTYLSLIGEKSGSSTFDIGMTQDQLAQYLCVNRSVLSKELNEMRRAGLIDYHKKQFTLLRNAD